ncbi:MAG: hypothetical protein KDD55_04540, partial [Bdellovibrionales bacterium]|nr:hypothetical protein [Bdellovibrionales bacterium]
MFFAFFFPGCHPSKETLSSSVIFPQTQSAFEIYQGAPLVISNSSGQMRPYLLRDGDWTPLFPSAIEKSIYDSDFYKPLVVENRNILFSVQHEGRPPFDIYLFDTNKKTLENLTRTPQKDEGGLCVSPSGKFVSYRSDHGQEVKKMHEWKSLRTEGPIPKFLRCQWISDSQFLGVQIIGNQDRLTQYQLHVCTKKQDLLQCQTRSALNDINHFLGFSFLENSYGFIGNRRGHPFRRRFAFTDSFSSLTLDQTRPAIEGDILEQTTGGFRLGLKSRYTYVTPHDSIHFGPVTVFSLKPVGKAVFGVVASKNTPKVIAQYENGDWSPLFSKNTSLPQNPPQIQELWLKGNHDEYQAFLFSQKKTPNLIVWLHGGPRENVSPRYNPYFHMLNEFGFSVLALNYPGSTGRGWEYEARYTKKYILDALTAVSEYSHSQNYAITIPWSISAGYSVLKLWAASQIPLSAAIEQAGAASARSRKELRDLLNTRNIPLFSIRGKHDRAAGGETEFLYNGGHDITNPAHFIEMMKEIERFLTP